jgi:electron transfer flavoprotein beta subunit
MKIAVCVKHAVDEAELKVDASGKPQLAGAVSRMSTFDKNAVEEALRLRAAHGGEVVVFTVGAPDARKTLKEALAMGGDKGAYVSVGTMKVDSQSTAALLAAAIRRDGPFDVVICSEGSSDTYSGQVPPVLGEVLGAAYVGYVRKIEVADNRAHIERSLEESIEVVEAPFPLVVSVVSEINEPRYPTLIQIMQASKKPIEELAGDALMPSGASAKVSVLSISAQSTNRKHIMIGGAPAEAAANLINSLTKEGVLAK